jgi:signal transduction histidine kinase
MGYVGVTFIVITAYNFISVFLNKKSETKLIILSYIIGAFFVLPIFFSNLLLKEVFLYSWGYYPYIGSMHLVYMVFLIAIIARFVYLLYDNYRQAKMSTDASEKNRSKYMLMASIIFSFAAIDFLPGYHINIYPFGFIFVLLFSGLMTYAILRHQLLDIQIIIKRTLVFAGLLASIFAILVLPTLLIQEYIFRSASAGGKLVGLALSGVIIILFLRRIESILINVTDKYLFQKKYSYRELLKTFTTEVLTVVNMDKLLNLTVDKLVDVVKISSSAVLLLNEEKRQFDVAASRNVKDSKVTLLKPDGIVTFLEHTHGYLLKRELAEKRVYIPPEIQEIIDKLNAELIIPMVLHTEVKGILSLGKKKSDEDYTQDDLDILLPLARTLAIAISNAKLFDELGKTQAEAAQREKMAVIGTLSAGINHEICNPLGIARGQCEAFLLNLKDGLYNNKTDQELLEKSKDIMAKVIKETDRATAITKKLSGFAKPSKGEEEIIVIDKEIDDVLDLVGYELKLEKIEFEKCIENNLPNIFVDKKQFQEVLFNLIRNAGQAIGEKGKITVIAKHNDGKILIDIKDTGSGVPENKIRELFNPFFTTKEPGKGTGLGLFIVRQVVEKNGGKIYLKETRVGEGTTFTVEFPAITAKESGV